MKNLKFIFAFLFLILVSCNQQSITCDTVEITIENSFHLRNGGKPTLSVVNDDDRRFICERINRFGEGKRVEIVNSYGDMDIHLDNQVMQVIFTQEHGVVYSVGLGKYVYDEELTARLMQMMNIKKRCWGEGC